MSCVEFLSKILTQDGSPQDLSVLKMKMLEMDHIFVLTEIIIQRFYSFEN